MFVEVVVWVWGGGAGFVEKPKKKDKKVFFE
jgi:hypothetical protein